jgi:hypothetical protein
MTASITRHLAAVVTITAVFYIVMAGRFIDRLEPLTGDEPFYVMTAISIIRDHDLDEANNYAVRDYDEFYPSEPLPVGWDGWTAFPRTLPPHPAVSRLDGLHTKHGLGLTFLIAAPYEALGREGAVGVVLVMAILVAANMYYLALDAGATPNWAVAIAVMLAISMPIAPYAALLFPEIPAALLLTYAVRRLAASENGRVRWLLTGASIGYLPWLHQRFAPTAVVLVVIALATVWRERNAVHAAFALVPIAIGGFSLIAYNLWLYGGPFQNTADHAGFNGASGTINASFGLLLDAQWGLLIAAPVYLVALAGIVAWWRVSTVARIAVLAVIPYLIVVATYRVWWGEWGPPARYLVPIAPFAAGTLAAIVTKSGMFGRFAVVIGWSLGMIVMIVGLANPQRFYHQPDGVNNLYRVVDSWTGSGITDRLVAFQPYTESPFSDRFLAGLALVAVLAAVSLAISMTGKKGRFKLAVTPDSAD